MHPIQKAPAGNTAESANSASLAWFSLQGTYQGCFSMALKVKHLLGSMVAYMHPIQKASAGNTADSAIQEGITRICHQKPALDAWPCLLE